MPSLILISAASGVGKSTLCDALRGRLPEHACLDTDGLDVNWWDYAGTDREAQFTDDCLRRAAELADGRSLVFVACLHPVDFLRQTVLPDVFDAVYFTGLCCAPEVLRTRLLARPAERMCGDEAFIRSQIAYNDWFLRHGAKLSFHLDNTALSISETADRFAAYIRALPSR